MTTKRTELKVFRVKLGLTQAQVAEKIGCSASQYAQVEQGNRNGTHDFWLKLQKAFNIADREMWELMKVDK